MASNDQIITLVTGANGGIGFDLVAKLLADSPHNLVLLGARSESKGQAAVKDLLARNLPGTVELLIIDISSPESIEAAAKQVESKYGRLDTLVNNAAITGGAASTPSEAFATAFQTNVTGVTLTIESFAPLLEKSAHTPRIVNVSTGQGSIASKLDRSNPYSSIKAIPYRSSKAALNMVTACFAYEYAPKGWKVFSYCPGFTVSNLSQMNKEENGAQPVEAASGPLLKILKGEKDSEADGAFLNSEGGIWPW